MRRSGKVRDYDVAWKFISKRDGRNSAVLKEFGIKRKRCVTSLLEAVQEALEDDEVSRSLHLSRKTEAAFEVSATSARAALEQRVEAYRKILATIGNKKVPLRKLHKLRISAKKLRYTLELLSPAASKSGLGKELKEVQSALGDINDWRAVANLLRRDGKLKDLRRQFKRKAHKKARKFVREFKPRLTASR